MPDNNSLIEIPERINGLHELAYNLWWSWHIQARELFNSLDRPLWKLTGHNPVQLLQRIAPSRLIEASQNPDFLRLYDSVMNDFNYNISSSDTWFARKYPDLSKHTVAYFSLEFAIHNSLPLYAGGLGILAGDYIKEASDLGIPMIGIGFMYPQGYFRQRISAEGWQEEIYDELQFDESPIIQLVDQQGKMLEVTVPLDNRSIQVSVWQVNVGRVKLYLLDTNIDSNSPTDRHLSDRLYTAEREMRLEQEIIIGIGGVRVLRALNIQPMVWHANEGHTAFMMLERIAELVDKGISFDNAVAQVRATSIFTTHTPVPAGNEVFSSDLIEKCFHSYWTNLNLNKNTFLQLGALDSNITEFNMTVLGLKLADYRNAVSKLHEKVCHRMWKNLWPDKQEKDVPITSVTNGVHVPTWITPQMSMLYGKYLSSDWLKRQDDTTIWENITKIPDEEIWAARRWLKSKLVSAIDDAVRKRWSEDAIQPVQAIAMGVFLSMETLTIGFSRRFTGYKRNDLILKHIDRLKKILRNQSNPVQIVFAGKSHPADGSGKYFIQQIFNAAKEPEIGGRIAFVENYDMHMARYLISGVDVWLNTPQPMKEACGTSGMKAALNGVPNISVLDGWWHEGYNGSNGWAINPIHNDPDGMDSPEQDDANANELYDLLEEKIIPLYYKRDIYGIPHDWIRLIKQTIQSIGPVYNACRMAKEYTENMYVMAAKNSQLV